MEQGVIASIVFQEVKSEAGAKILHSRAGRIHLASRGRPAEAGPGQYTPEGGWGKFSESES